MRLPLWQDYLSLLRREFSGYSFRGFQTDLLAGLTVAAVALPLALAFGVASGVDAAAGLVTAVVAGFLIALLGGAPYQISGPTGAMSAVLIVVASRYGLQGVWIAGLLSGFLLMLLGIFHLGRVVALIPTPVISGFTSGIAVLIAFGQINNALGLSTPNFERIVDKLGYYAQQSLSPNVGSLWITVLVIAIMLLWPRAKGLARIPGSLVAILAATLLAIVFGLDIPVIGAIPSKLVLDQRLQIEMISMEIMGPLFVPAMTIAALGAIESLLCGAVAGNMTGIRLHNSVELVAQGIGNLVIPFFGGVPATAAIARTSVNIKSGGITRLSSIVHSAALLVAALLLAGAMGRIPLSALAGVLLVTAWRMNEWHAIRFFFGRRIKHAMLAFVITLLATLLLDLTQAIIIGFGVSSLIFMAQISDLYIDRKPLESDKLQVPKSRRLASHLVIVYYLSGPLFFATARRLMEEIERLEALQTILILSMRGVPLVDATGVEVLREAWQRQHEGGGDLLVSGLQPRVQVLLQRSGFLAQIGAQRVFWSADQAILSLSQPVEHAEPITEGVGNALDTAQLLTPYEERFDEGL